MVMIEQPPPPGCTGAPYLQMHLATAPATLIMNNANYTALLAFCEGNLKELSAMPNSGGTTDEAHKNTTFNPDFRFGPPTGVPPTFRMTLDVPEFLVRCAAASRKCGTVKSPLHSVCILPEDVTASDSKHHRPSSPEAPLLQCLM